MSEKTGDTLWQPDGSGGVQPQRVGGGSRSSQLPEGLVLEAPANGSPHARQDGAWVPVPVDEAPEDGSLYLRGNGGWALYTPPAPGVDEAPQDGVKYVRVDGVWEPLSPISGDLSLGGDVIAQGFITLANPSRGLAVGNRNYNDDRYAASTETWYRLNNSFSADNAVQVWLTSGVKDDYGTRLFTRSNDKLYPTRSGTWMYSVTAGFENLDDFMTQGNRMLAIRKNGATVLRDNFYDDKSMAIAVTATVVLGSTDYLAVEMRVGHSTTADVYLQATNLGPV